MLRNNSHKCFFNASLAFTLIEVIAVCTILGVLFAISLPSIQSQVWDSKKKAEDSQLEYLAQIINSSFESNDLQGTNIASFADSIPRGTDPTQFSITTDVTVVPSICAMNDWYVKIAHQAGFNSQLGSAPTRSLQPQLANILINPSNNTRIMLAGPSNEFTQQRFLILSLLTPSGEVQLPNLPDPNNANTYITFFNDIWNTDWTYREAKLPQSWISLLTPLQQSAWLNNNHSSTNINLLRVKRITCPKYSLTINNTHPTDNCYIYYNFNGTTAGYSTTITSNSGVFTIQSILYGRQIQAYRGLGEPPTASLFSQFTLRDNSEITLQD
jgi:type II secretory pathway pseudopilin PulG